MANMSGDQLNNYLVQIEQERESRPAEAALADAICLLREALLVVASETEGRRWGKPAYDLTWDHLHEVAMTALEATG